MGVIILLKWTSKERAGDLIMQEVAQNGMCALLIL